MNENGTKRDEWEDFVNQSKSFRATNEIIDGIDGKIKDSDNAILDKEEEIRAKEREINNLEGNCDQPSCSSYLKNQELQQKNLGFKKS